MAFSTGNPQFDFLMSRARNRRRSREALQENNIDVETSLEKREGESESSDVTSIGTQVADISGLGASGISATGPSQSIADAQEMMDIAGVGKGQTVGQVAFDTEMDRAKADFAQSNPVGAAIAGFSTDAIAQGVVQTAPLGLAMAGQMGAAKAAANIGSVISGPAFGLISGVIGPTMQDPYGKNVAMGSALLGQVSQSLMSTHYSVADKVAQGVPGYAQGYYGGNLVSVTPGLFGIGLTYTGVNVPDIHQYSPSQFMADIEAQKAYADEVEPFGGFGSTSVISDPSTISVDTFSSPTAAAMAGVGYSSYDPTTGKPTGTAPPGSSFSSTGKFTSGDNSSTSTSSGSLGTTDVSTSGLGSIDDSYGYGDNNDNSSTSTSSGSLGGGEGVGASTGAGSTSGIDGVEAAATQEAADSSGAGSESDKIVCTAMNEAYGFGSFRQTIWLKHSRNLDPAYQVGYHKIFRPLIKYAYKENNLPNRIVKKWLEGVAKRRTADIWLQQRGKKRHIGGRIERAILEPICYIVGKI